MTRRTCRRYPASPRLACSCHYRKRRPRRRRRQRRGPAIRTTAPRPGPARAPRAGTRCPGQPQLARSKFPGLATGSARARGSAQAARAPRSRPLPRRGAGRGSPPRRRPSLRTWRLRARGFGRRPRPRRAPGSRGRLRRRGRCAGRTGPRRASRPRPRAERGPGDPGHARSPRPGGRRRGSRPRPSSSPPRGRSSGRTRSRFAEEGRRASRGGWPPARLRCRISKCKPSAKSPQGWMGTGVGRGNHKKPPTRSVGFARTGGTAHRDRCCDDSNRGDIGAGGGALTLVVSRADAYR